MKATSPNTSAITSRPFYFCFETIRCCISQNKQTWLTGNKGDRRLEIECIVTSRKLFVKYYPYNDTDIYVNTRLLVYEHFLPTVFAKLLTHCNVSICHYSLNYVQIVEIKSIMWNASNKAIKQLECRFDLAAAVGDRFHGYGTSETWLSCKCRSSGERTS